MIRPLAVLLYIELSLFLYDHLTFNLSTYLMMYTSSGFETHTQVLVIDVRNIVNKLHHN